MSPEVLWVDVLQPGGVHQAAAPDEGLAGVDHLCVDHQLGLLLEHHRLRVDVAVLAAVQRNVVA